MKKIVINTKHGGFGLSALAIKRYLELNGKECCFYETKGHQIFPITLEEAQKDTHWTAFTVSNPEQYLNLSKPWYDLSEQEREEFNKTWDSLSVYSSDIERDDKNLIQTIEELKEKANSRFADLKIVEIPDDVEWTIEDYDGVEWVSEKHRTWD